ncbi:hypothetical protein Hdeb2414_s0006g00202911 [Helianthus debilis subsp. tardiflorus]
MTTTAVASETTTTAGALGRHHQRPPNTHRISPFLISEFRGCVLILSEPIAILLPFTFNKLQTLI